MNTIVDDLMALQDAQTDITDTIHTYTDDYSTDHDGIKTMSSPTINHGDPIISSSCQRAIADINDRLKTKGNIAIESTDFQFIEPDRSNLEYLYCTPISQNNEACHRIRPSKLYRK